MSDRTRHARDVRILPVVCTPGAASSQAGRAPAATAAQFARLLAAQTAAGSLAPISSDAGGNADQDSQDEPEQSPPDTLVGAAPAEPARLDEPAARAEAPPAHEPPARTENSIAPGRLRPHNARNPAVSKPSQPEHDTQLGKQIVHACTAAAHGDLLTRELADRIARFCAMSGAGGDSSWAVTLPMNPAVLPDTLLHLQLSPSSIAIRFETPNARSQQLISDNADALRVRLADALGRQIDVEVAASSV
jgi:type III secretion control protein HpaP